MIAEELFELIAQGEGQRLEFKRGIPSIKNLASTVICFANAEGGKILLGVDKQGQIVGCSQYNIPDLVSGVYRSTEPPITIEIEEVATPQGMVLAIHVPRSPLIHATTGGVYRKRVGRECLPLSPQEVIAQQAERATLDYSARSLDQASYPENVETRALEAIRTEIGRRNPALAAYSDLELLRNLGLIRNNSLTVAALLLLGKSDSIRQYLPQAEVSYLRQKGETEISLSEHLYLPLPFLLQRLEELIEAANEMRSIQYGLLRIDIPDFPKRVYREAILNAVSHRNYALPGNVVIRHFPDRLEVSSPGGFPTGVSVANILRQIVPRNRLLADALHRIGYVERAGIGVDMMFEELLRLGKEPPEFDAQAHSVRVIIRNASFDERFVSFVEDTLRSGKSLPLDYLLVLAHLKRRLELDRSTAGALLQRSDREASEILSSMVREGFLEKRGVKKGAIYHLATKVAEKLGLPSKKELIEAIRHEEMVLRYVREKGSIGNAECRELCGLALKQASYLLSRMAKSGKLMPVGEKRWRRYVLPPSKQHD